MDKKTNFFRNGDLAWRLGEFSLIKEVSGELGVLEYQREIDFDVKRIFFLRNIDKDSARGSHSHRVLKQVVICLAGSFVLKLDDGSQVSEFHMNNSSEYLYLDGRVWREMHDFSSDAIMLVLCDREYCYDEVIRDYPTFKNISRL